ncbi:MAG TPA: ATPase, T2SS/T4P/T4SS family [Gemmatimonadales bacterium]|nr:ATPase, T2SS/T4P/T4SS family [Gemmatimonadales bacterium]
MSIDPAPAQTPQAVRDLRAAAVGPLANRVSPKYLEEHSLLPLAVVEDGTLLVAVAGALDPAVADELRQTYGRRLTLVQAPAAEIQSAILSASNEPPSSSRADLRTADLEVLAPEEEAIDDLRALASQAPVIKLVNVILLEALRLRASDVHLESTAQGLRIRYRIDGVLQEVSNPARQYQAAVISRIKIMASLNIAERRQAQDGRIRLRLSDRELDLRVSTLPALHGESVVLRILDRGTGVPDLADLGMPDAELSNFARLIRQPHGIILVTGPTGSGKTTTLYGALRRINQPGVKIVTVEDPIEYQIEGLTQVPVVTKGGLTFASALRSILRHDPDIIMVGEMRDTETAEISIQAALTGHLVFSTLHTNDAPGGITRLADMGVEPFLIAATVRGILAQRLLRVVCDSCDEPYQPSSAELAQMRGAADPRRNGADSVQPEPGRFRRGRGCDACAGSGYRGRTGIYELMIVSDEIRALIVAGAPLDDIRALARTQGMVALRENGWGKVRAGITTIDELLRVTSEDELR